MSWIIASNFHSRTIIDTGNTARTTDPQRLLSHQSCQTLRAIKKRSTQSQLPPRICTRCSESRSLDSRRISIEPRIRVFLFRRFRHEPWSDGRGKRKVEIAASRTGDFCRGINRFVRDGSALSGLNSAFLLDQRADSRLRDAFVWNRNHGETTDSDSPRVRHACIPCNSNAPVRGNWF